MTLTSTLLAFVLFAAIQSQNVLKFQNILMNVIQGGADGQGDF